MLTDGVKIAEGARIVNAVVDSGTSYPSTPDTGELFYRTDLSLLKVYDGTAWVTVGATSNLLDGQPGSFYLDNANATGIMAVVNGGTGASTPSAARTALGIVIGTDVQAYDGDLAAIAALAGTSGLARKTAANTWTLDTTTYLSSISSGDVTTALGFTPLDKAGDTMTGLLILSGDPVSNLGAVTKQYVDGVAAGLNVHASCQTATTATLASSSAGTITYNNGTAGVGATLTTTGSFATIGGYTTSNGNRILVKNEADATTNGVYTRTSATVLTRATDFDNSPVGEITAGDFMFIVAGTLAGTNWAQTTDGTIVVGTSAINFTQLSGPGVYSAGTGIDISSNIISNTGVLSNVAGTGISVSGATGNVTITNTGVTSAVAGSNISVSGATGAVTFSVTGTVPSATLAANITGGLAGNIAYQTGASSTAFLTTGTSSEVLVSGTTPAWSSAPAIAGTNFTGTGASFTAGAATLAANSSQLNGLASATTATATTIAARDGSGNLFAVNFNQSSANSENPGVSQVMVTNGTDNVVRKAAISHLTSALSGTAPINISGTAATATNVAGGDARRLLYQTAAGTTSSSAGFVTGGTDGANIGNSLTIAQVGGTAGRMLTLVNTTSAVGDAMGIHFASAGSIATAQERASIRAIVEGSPFNGALVFSTGLGTAGTYGTGTMTERMRITGAGALSVGATGTATGTSGQVLTSAGSAAPPTWSSSSITIGTTAISLGGTSATLAGLSSVIAGTSGNGQLRVLGSGASNTGYIEFISAGGVRQGYIGFSSTTAANDAGTIPYIAAAHSFSGSITASGDITAFSDRRVKANIEIIPNALSKVEKLRGVTFTRTDVDNKEKRHTGVIAQELREVLPEAVRETDDGILTVAYGNTVGLLIEAIKELSSQNKALLARLEVLEGKE